MNQIKIGKFIADCRKEKSLTQSQLAEKLNITDRAVSKWETGRAMPDSSLMLELCDILDITVTDLLNGERVDDNRPDINEAQLLEAVKEKQQADKKVLKVAALADIVTVLFFICCCVIIRYTAMPEWTKYTIVALCVVIVLAVGLAFLKIDQTTGYYKCAKCGKTHKPTYSKLLWAMHFDIIKYLKCPHCGKWSWQKKTFEKNEDCKLEKSE